MQNFMAILWGSLVLAFAQTNASQPHIVLPSVEEVHRSAEATGSQIQLNPERPECDSLSGKAKDACTDAMIEHYRYAAERIVHRRETLEWQLFAAKLIFVVVLLLVFSGLGLAFVQFRHSLKPHILPKAATPQELSADKDVAGLTADLEISLAKIKISSSILGLLILVVSMAFFYLYLVYVYPIHELGAGSP